MAAVKVVTVVLIKSSGGRAGNVNPVWGYSFPVFDIIVFMISPDCFSDGTEISSAKYA
ncbi:hypothetical protein SDC9_209602 [bioreactor metagenome]|uniref:Uncharacterized protein n=1 Tax=bioreactor metagenome TaxID=1076179 RepID=A0A645JER9_9ZZZZ